MTEPDHPVSPVRDFLAVYGRTDEELLDAESLSAPGAFSGEKEFLEFADRDYETDKHWAFEIRPEECALIVVDLQEDFVNPGNPMCVPEAYRQIPRVLELIEVCRERRVPVIFTEHGIAPDCAADFYEFWDPIAHGAIREGAPATGLYHGLQRRPSERIIKAKHTYDSFAGTDLDYVLRSQRIRTVIVCGTLTNFCCESTARTAYFLNYHVVFGSDVNATDSAHAHTASLRTIRRGFGRVMSGQQIIAALRYGDQLFKAAHELRASGGTGAGSSQSRRWPPPAAQTESRNLGFPSVIRSARRKRPDPDR